MTDYTWDGGGDGTSWTDDDNWGGSGHPNSNNDKATINVGSASISMDIAGGTGVVGEVYLGSGFTGTVTQAYNFTIDNAGSENGVLEINNSSATWNCNGSTLTVDSHIKGNGTFTVGTSTVTCTGQTTVGTFNITTGTYNYFDDFRPTTANITDNATINQTSTGGQLGGRLIITASKTPTFNAIGRFHSSFRIDSGEQGNSTINLDLSEPQTGPSRALFFYNLELDSEGTENNKFTMGGAITCTGDLTITDGEIDTTGSNHALTVDKTCKIQGGTLTCNASAVSFGQQILSSASYGLHLTSGTFTGGTGTHTISIFYQTGGTCTLTSGTTTMNGYQTSGAYSFKKEGGTFTQTAGTVDMTNTSAQVLQLSSNPTFFNLTLSGGRVLSVYNWDTTRTITVAGALTISAGTTFNTQYQALAANILNVTGLVTLNGKLEAHDSTDGTVSDEKDLSFGSLTIASGGEYSATGGTTTLNGNFDNDGTFTANSGTCLMDASSGNITLNGTGAVEPTFHNVTYQGSSDVRVANDITIENTLTVDGSRFLFGSTSGGGATNAILTMGTASSKGALTVNSGKKFDFYIYGDNQTDKLQAASSLYPVDVTNNGTLNFSVTTSEPDTGKVQLADINYIGALTLDNGDKVELTGDCEFDGVTVSTGATLDLNGQRAEFTGSVTYSGTLNVSGSLAIFHSDFTKYGTLNNADSGDIITMASSGTPTFSYITGYRTFFQNGGVQLGTGGWSNVSNAIVAGNTKVGTRNTSSETLRLVDGCVFETSGTTHTVSGNCEFGGGIIGRSALVFDGTGDVVNCGTDSDLNITSGGLTYECWVKDDGKDNTSWRYLDKGTVVWLGGDSGSHGGAVTDSVVRFVVYNGTDGNNILLGNTYIDDGKWHHIAGVLESDGKTMKIYVDGKLDATRVNTTANPASSSNKLVLGGYDDGAGGYVGSFDGTMGRASVWNTPLTQTQIRARMFSDFAGLDSNSGCVGWWQFDEGSGAAVANKGSAGTDADGSIVNATWATMGDSNFTYVDSTLDLTGTGDFVLTNGGNFKVYNLTMAAASKTTTLIHMPGSSMNVYGTHTVGAGTYTTAGTPSVTYQGTGTVSDGGAGFVANYISYWSSSTPVPAAKFRFFISDQAPTNLGGDIVCEGPSGNLGSAYFRGGGYTTNTNNYQVTTPKWVFDASTTMNIGSSTIILNSTDGLSTSSATSVLSAGPGCIITGTNAATTFKSQGHWEIVGNISNLNVTNEELAVFGKVTNCTGDIHQWLPHFEKDVILDAGALADVPIDQGDDIDRNNELLN